MIQGFPTPPPSIPMNPSDAMAAIVAIVAIAAGALALRWLFHSPIGEAIAEGIRMRRRRRYGEVTGEVTADGRRVDALDDHIAQLQSQVSELAERLDFTERVLAERRERKLGAGQ
jgi:hypothetical protein